MGNADAGLGNWLVVTRGTAAPNHIRTLLKVDSKNPLDLVREKDAWHISYIAITVGHFECARGPHTLCCTTPTFSFWSRGACFHGRRRPPGPSAGHEIVPSTPNVTATTFTLFKADRQK